MSSFEGNKTIILQPRDYKIGYGFNITQCSSSNANNGFLPYGDTISSVEVKAFKTADEDGKSLSAGETDVTAEMIEGVPIRVDNLITVVLSYPTTSGKGYYKLRFVITLLSSGIMEADFNRIIAKDK